jgi:hypothetical protein
MPTRSKAWLLIAALALVSTMAKSDGIGPGAFGQNTFGGIGTGSGSSPPTGNALVLEDGTSNLLLEDGSSNLCLEGGC